MRPFILNLLCTTPHLNECDPFFLRNRVLKMCGVCDFLILVDGCWAEVQRCDSCKREQAQVFPRFKCTHPAPNTSVYAPSIHFQIRNFLFWISLVVWPVFSDQKHWRRRREGHSRLRLQNNFIFTWIFAVLGIIPLSEKFPRSKTMRAIWQGLPTPSHCSACSYEPMTTSAEL